MAFLPSPALPLSSSKRSPAPFYCQVSSPPLSPTKRFTRRFFLATIASATGTLVANAAATASQPSTKLEYTVVKSGTGPSAEIGDLVGIRFKGMYNGVVFDNLFDDTKPYFYRAGSGTILKGLEEAVMLMKVGDVYDLTLPGELAFGVKGRKASPGKPSIPPNATVNYTLELTTIPGKEIELLEGSDEYQ